MLSGKSIIFMPATNNVAFILQVLFFAMCLTPMSFDYANTAISINYLFCLAPFCFFLARRTVVIPAKPVLVAILAFAYIYLYGFTNQDLTLYFEIRRFLSFVAFCSMFALCFMYLDFSVVLSFMVALVLVTTGLAISKFYNIYLHAYPNGFSSDVFFNGDLSLMKNIVGSSRTGFLYLTAIFVVLFCKLPILRLPFLGPCLLFLNLAGAFLTFARSTAFTGFVISLCCLSLVFLNKVEVNKFLLKRENIIAFLFLVGSFFLLMPGALWFYIAPLFELFSIGDVNTVLDFEKGGSADYRVSLWSEIISGGSYLGSNFQGVWALQEDNVGSAHSEYLDVFYRVGYIGSGIVFAIFCFVLKEAYKNYPVVFVMFLTCLIYGFFHESFKESHGKLCLAFSVALCLQPTSRSFTL